MAAVESLRSELIHDGSRVQVTIVHLPAINTPQFGWVKTRLPRKPQPVPPIFQPEVAAEAILFAATHKRRDLWLGFPTVKTIIGNRLAPGYVDHYLADNLYEAQQYDGFVDPDRQHNLWEPVPGDHGAHGDFDERATDFSSQFWLTKHVRSLSAAGLAGLALAALIAFRRR